MDIVESATPNAPGVLTLTLTGRIDAITTDGFSAAVTAVIDRGERRLVLDLAGIDYISSIGLRALILAAKRLAALDGRIALSAPQPRIKQLLDVAGFTPLFPIAASPAEAAERMT
jgi:anti-sigma B factor antagonist